VTTAQWQAARPQTLCGVPARAGFPVRSSGRCPVERLDGMADKAAARDAEAADSAVVYMICLLESMEMSGGSRLTFVTAYPRRCVLRK
jgi:hypothetical protein